MLAPASSERSLKAIWLEIGSLSKQARQERTGLNEDIVLQRLGLAESCTKALLDDKALVLTRHALWLEDDVELLPGPEGWFVGESIGVCFVYYGASWLDSLLVHLQIACAPKCLVCPSQVGCRESAAFR